MSETSKGYINALWQAVGGGSFGFAVASALTGYISIGGAYAIGGAAVMVWVAVDEYFIRKGVRK